MAAISAGVSVCDRAGKAQNYFDEHEDALLVAAIYLYERDEISFGKAARLAGVSRFDMPDILREYGVEVKLGPDDMEDAEREIDVARISNERGSIRLDCSEHDCAL